MPPSDGSEADPKGLGQKSEVGDAEVHTQLVEALVHLLIEKGILTKNDALSVVQTVAQVQQGRAIEAGVSDPQSQPILRMLARMYGSFEALTDRPGQLLAGADNVHQLRPPIYGDGRPEFPPDD